MKVDLLVVGAGLSGAVIAERAASVLKKEVLVIDRRDHIGGNIYDYKNEHGIMVHRYGPHAFHTNSKKVWDYLSCFTGWETYCHKVLAKVHGIEFPLPFNINSLYKVFPPNLASKLEDRLIEAYGYDVKVPILRLRESVDKDLKFAADFVYRKIFLGYTLKQWGMRPEDLDSSVTARVPVYIGRDDRYFQDKYQGIPEQGYTELISNMLDNPRIKVELGVHYRDIKDKVSCRLLIYTGAIDEFFGYMHGKLPYRSLDFVFKTYDREYFQSVAQINYPLDYDFTRITEYKHFYGTKTDKTTLAFEYPREFITSMNEEYYPIPKRENDERYELYKAEAEELDNVIFLGRLAEYRYYNMDEAVKRALDIFDERIK